MSKDRQDRQDRQDRRLVVANHDNFIFFSMFRLWRMCLKPILQNVNVPAATMAILAFFVANHDYFIFFSMFWLWRMCLKSILQNVNVPAATMAILTFFVANHDYFIFQELNFSQHNSWISAEEIPDMATLNFQKNSETRQNNTFFKWKCFCSITPPLRYGLA